MTPGPNTFIGPEPHIKYGFTRLVELTPDEAASYRDLLTGLFEKYSTSWHDAYTRSWVKDGVPHCTTTLRDRTTSTRGVDLEFAAWRDDITGQITSHVSI